MSVIIFNIHKLITLHHSGVELVYVFYYFYLKVGIMNIELISMLGGAITVAVIAVVGRYMWVIREEQLERLEENKE